MVNCMRNSWGDDCGDENQNAYDKLPSNPKPSDLGSSGKNTYTGNSHQELLPVATAQYNRIADRLMLKNDYRPIMH